MKEITVFSCATGKIVAVVEVMDGQDILNAMAYNRPQDGVWCRPIVNSIGVNGDVFCEWGSAGKCRFSTR